jgi:hypothetical protein
MLETATAPAMLLRAIAVWLVFMFLAVGNGVFRMAALKPRLGELRAHQVSTLILCALIFGVTWPTIEWIGADSVRAASAVGRLWLILTLAFEFLAGHYLFGNPWEKILADYNVFKGRVWILVPLTVLLAPVVAVWLR